MKQIKARNECIVKSHKEYGAIIKRGKIKIKDCDSTITNELGKSSASIEPSVIMGKAIQKFQNMEWKGMEFYNTSFTMVQHFDEGWFSPHAFIIRIHCW